MFVFITGKSIVKSKMKLTVFVTLVTMLSMYINNNNNNNQICKAPECQKTSVAQIIIIIIIN